MAGSPELDCRRGHWQTTARSRLRVCTRSDWLHQFRRASLLQGASAWVFALLVLNTLCLCVRIGLRIVGSRWARIRAISHKESFVKFSAPHAATAAPAPASFLKLSATGMNWRVSGLWRASTSSTATGHAGHFLFLSVICYLLSI